MISDTTRWIVAAGAYALVAIAQAQGTGAAAERRYALADHGFLVMTVPAGWKEEVRRHDAATPPTITYSPESGAPFNVLVTPIWPMNEKMGKPTPEEMKRSVASAAEGAKAEAVEKSIEVVELKGPAAQGYYFKATDRAPKRGEFKYLAQGMLGLGEIRITFTILTNDGQGPVVEAALGMLRNARLGPMRGGK